MVKNIHQVEIVAMGARKKPGRGGIAKKATIVKRGSVYEIIARNKGRKKAPPK